MVLNDIRPRRTSPDCGHGTCGRSIASTILLAVALWLVLVLPSSADADSVRHVSAIEAAQLLKEKPNIVVLDIRSPREFRDGHISGARNINYYAMSFRNRVAELDKNVTYLVHCAAGYRSSWSLGILRRAGLKGIIHMKDGLNAWKRAGLSLRRQ